MAIPVDMGKVVSFVAGVVITALILVVFVPSRSDQSAVIKTPAPRKLPISKASSPSPPVAVNTPAPGVGQDWPCACMANTTKAAVLGAPVTFDDIVKNLPVPADWGKMFDTYQGFDSTPQMGDLYSTFTKTPTQCMALCLFELAKGGKPCRVVVWSKHNAVCYLKSTAFRAHRIMDAGLSSYVLKEEHLRRCECNEATTNSLPAPRVPYQKFVGKDSSGSDMFSFMNIDADACMARCTAISSCKGIVQGELTCWLKSTPYAEVERHDRVSYFTEIAATVAPNPPIDILFGVLAGPQFLTTRLSWALSTWLYDVESVAFVENQHVDECRTVVKPFKADHGVRVTCMGITVQDSSINGAWKNLPMVDMLVTLFPNRSWYMIVDDDTYVIQQNLQMLLTRYNSPAQMATPIYLGIIFTSGVSPMIYFIQGGAGILFNRMAGERFQGPYQNKTCRILCQQWAGDIRMGCCMKLAGVEPMGTNELWSLSPMLAMGRDNRQLLSNFPVSFHQMRNQTFVYDMFAAVQTVLYADVGKDMNYFQKEGCLGDRGWRTDGRFCGMRPGAPPVPWRNITYWYLTQWRGSRYPDDWYAKELGK